MKVIKATDAEYIITPTHGQYHIVKRNRSGEHRELYVSEELIVAIAADIRRRALDAHYDNLSDYDLITKP